MIRNVSHRPPDGRPADARAPAALVAVGIAAIVALGGLAGCGGGGGESTTGAGSAGTAGTQTGATSSRSTTTGRTTAGGGGATTGAQVQNGHTIRDVVNAVLASGDPDKACASDYVTDKYVSDAYGDEKGCVQAQAKASAADSVRIESPQPVSVDPPTASVKATPQGGLYDGEELTIRLVKEDDVWKLDSLESKAPVGP